MSTLPKRQTVTRKIDIETDWNIDELIQYLLEIRLQHPEKTITLYTYSDGYDEAYLALNYRELETDEEYRKRVQEIEIQRRVEEQRLQDEKERKQRAYARELEELQRKYKM